MRLRPSQARERGAYGIRTRATAVRGRRPRPLDECAERFSVAPCGYDGRVGLRDRIFGRKDDEPTAARQEGDPTVLNREDEPRGGTQSEEYRHADPRDVVEEGGTAMSGPGGAPQEGLSPEERRQLDRETD